MLVELGGHASAPDLNADGRFDPGLDANWHVENLWGTRDVQATTGLGGIGKYQAAMTVSRKIADKIFPPDLNKDTAKLDLWRLEFQTAFKIP